MNNRNNIFLGVVFSVFLFAAMPAPSARADFSGSWVLKERNSLSGNSYANGIPNEIIFVQKADSAFISTIGLNQTGGYDTTILHLGMDGLPSKTLTPTNKIRSTNMEWQENQQSFIQIDNYYLEGNDKPDHKSTITWSISDKGNILTIVKLDENFINGETWSMKGIYDLQ